MLREAALPAILGAEDVARYHTILALQQEGSWEAADREIVSLHDRLLVGHVLAQRYLSRHYRASFAELHYWLSQYADHPSAPAIHALAMKHHPGDRHTPRPEGTPIALHGIVEDPADLRPPSRTSQNEAAARLRGEIRRLARSEPATAEQLLQRGDSEHLFDDAEYDDARADVAEGYLFIGESQSARLLAATTRSSAYRPLAHWDAGLAAWRLGRFGDARSHFETLARLPGLSPWTVSAAAFWAARVHARANHPEQAGYWLGVAADQPRTFYGLLARRTLGLETYFNFEPEIFTDIDLNALAGIPAARRAMALLQLGGTRSAELELRILTKDAPATLYPALIALADRGNMPALSVELATLLSQVDGRRHDHALYPVPRWEPQGGFKVDRALLFAVMRQESNFLPRAESSMGAVGLMQLMPSTAEAMAERLGIKLQAWGKTPVRVTDPPVNLALAQEYQSLLLEHGQIKGNLILFAAAYNSGQGNLLRWLARPEYRDDPLLFIECLPSRETRVFTERVLTNYWVYRMRLGQPSRDLDMLAAGEWPVYVALDTPQGEASEVASNAEDR